MSKKYSGPYGNYDAGSMGATMNALSVQENIPTTYIDNLVFGGAGLSTGQIRKGQGGPVVANYIWVGKHVFFEWLDDRKESIWAVAGHGIYHLRQKLKLVKHEIRFDFTKDMLPYEDERDQEACFKQLVHWFRVRVLSNGPFVFNVDQDKLSFSVTLKYQADIDEVVRDFEYFNGFRFQSDADMIAWVNSFSKDVVEKAEQMFRVFSKTVNDQPNQNYCFELKNMEHRMRVAWLELAWNELYN